MKLLLLFFIVLGSFSFGQQKVELFQFDHIFKRSLNEFTPVFNPDGTEMYFAVQDTDLSYNLYFSKYNDGNWSIPQKHFLDDFAMNIHQPFVNYDGNCLYFISYSREKKEILWCSKFEGEKWQIPKKLDTTINGRNSYEGFISEVNGYHYFYSNRNGGFDIYECEVEKGQIVKVENLKTISSRACEFNPAVSPDGKIMVFNSPDRIYNIGGHDLYVSFKDKNSEWTTPKDLGSFVNSIFHDFKPRFSPDGKYLYFTSNRPVYKDGEVIDRSMNAYRIKVAYLECYKECEGK